VNSREVHTITGPNGPSQGGLDAPEAQEEFFQMMDEGKAAGTESARPIGAGVDGGESAPDVAERARPIPDDEMVRLTDEIIAALKTVYDPEIPADLYELGLIYKIKVDDDRMVTVDMTLTTPNCPSAAELPSQVQNAVEGVSGVREAKVNIVWDPPWDTSRMSDEARTVLDMW
jgi:FeS assembly SUF system protein